MRVVDLRHFGQSQEAIYIGRRVQAGEKGEDMRHADEPGGRRGDTRG